MFSIQCDQNITAFTYFLIKYRKFRFYFSNNYDFVRPIITSVIEAKIGQIFVSQIIIGLNFNA